MGNGSANASDRSAAHSPIYLPSPNPEVVFRRVGDGGVLLSITDEVYFGLNGVGVEIWELLPPCTGSFADLCSELANRYPDVDDATLRSDAVELLDALASHRLVSWPSRTSSSNGHHGGSD